MSAARPARKACIAALWVALLLSGARAASASSTPPQWQAGQFGITVWPSPGPVYLCVGERMTGFARVYAYPLGPSSPSGGRLPFSNRSTLNPTLTDPIGSISTTGAIFSGAASYIQWSFTATDLGDAQINFGAQVRVGDRTYAVRGPTLDVTVTCVFKLDVISEWHLPGQRTHDVSSFVVDVIMAPDRATGLYQRDATAANEVHVEGKCTGGATLADSGVHFQGQLASSQPPEIHVQVVYDPAAANSWEGCAGKSSPGSGQAGPLSFIVDYSRLAFGPYTFSVPHSLQTDIATVQGNAVITVYP